MLVQQTPMIPSFFFHAHISSSDAAKPQKPTCAHTHTDTHLHLQYPVSSPEGAIMCCWAVRADVLDEDTPHHLAAAQSAAHASASHYADAQGLARRSSQPYAETQRRAALTLATSDGPPSAEPNACFTLKHRNSAS